MQQLLHIELMSPTTIKRTEVIIESVQYFCSILTKLVFSWQVFKQVFPYQISRNSFKLDTSWYRRTDGRTDTRNQTNILFLRVCESALINTINVIRTISSTCFRIQYPPMKMKVLLYPVFPDCLQSAAFGKLPWSLLTCPGKSNV